MKYAYFDTLMDTLVVSTELPSEGTTYWEVADNVDPNEIRLDNNGQLIVLPDSPGPWAVWNDNTQSYDDPRSANPDDDFLPIAENYKVRGSITFSGNTISWANVNCSRTNSWYSESKAAPDGSYTLSTTQRIFYFEWATGTVQNCEKVTDIPAGANVLVGEYRGGNVFLSNINGEKLTNETNIASSVIDTNNIKQHAVTSYRSATNNPQGEFPNFAQIAFNSVVGSKALAIIKFDMLKNSVIYITNPGNEIPGYMSYHELTGRKENPQSNTNNIQEITYNDNTTDTFQSNGTFIRNWAGRNAVIQTFQTNGNYTTHYSSSGNYVPYEYIGMNSTTVINPDGTRTETYINGSVKTINPDGTFVTRASNNMVVNYMKNDYVVHSFSGGTRVNNNTATSYSSYKRYNPNGVSQSGTATLTDDFTLSSSTSNPTGSTGAALPFITTGSTNSVYTGSFPNHTIITEFSCIDGVNRFTVSSLADNTNVLLSSIILLENKR